MNQGELRTMLHKHELWLNDKDGGKRANLAGANLAGANLTEADLTRANLTRANLDYSSWPLWCGSLKAHVNDRLAIQLLYHTLAVVMYSPNVTPDIKKALLTETNLDVANRFHRAEECGKLCYEAESHEA